MKPIRLFIVTILLLALAGCMSGQEMADGLGDILEEGASAMVTADAQDPAAEMEATIVAAPGKTLPSPAGRGDGRAPPYPSAMRGWRSISIRRPTSRRGLTTCWPA